MKFFPLTLFTLAATFAGTSNAASPLIEGCSNWPAVAQDKASIQGVMDAGYCMGYWNGFVANYRIEEALNPDRNGRRYCLPSGITPVQLAAQTRDWAAANPKSANDPDVMVAEIVLAANYPCGKK